MKKFAIITDFDGTITTRDIGNALCTHFGTMKAGKEIKDYDTKEDPTLWFDRFFGPIKASREEFESIILSYAIVKKGFEELVNFAREHKIPFEIVSGGLDIYIKPILKKHNLPPVPLYCVRGTLTPKGIKTAFPDYPEIALDDFKAQRVKYYKDKGYTTIFLGDGLVDLEAAKQADILFATAYLAELCDRNKIPYKEFKDFTKLLKMLKESYVSLPA
ncbi:MAG: HAD-IB family phosphatase [Elusimicrobiaceae bacterium]|nr:HAD-IB family phosphatase [Elusimicrobiaceae bacterium]